MPLSTFHLPSFSIYTTTHNHTIHCPPSIVLRSRSTSHTQPYNPLSTVRRSHSTVSERVDGPSKVHLHYCPPPLSFVRNLSITTHNPCSPFFVRRQPRQPIIKGIKVCFFYIAQYPVRWTAQSALHFSSPSRPVHSDTNSASRGSILAMQQLRNDYSLTCPPLSIARYSLIQLSRLRRREENENAQTSKR